MKEEDRPPTALLLRSSRLARIGICNTPDPVTCDALADRYRRQALATHGTDRVAPDFPDRSEKLQTHPSPRRAHSHLWNCGRQQRVPYEQAWFSQKGILM